MKHVSVKYDAHEDRLRLVCVCEGDKHTSILLTARLSRRLVKRVAKIVAKNSETQSVNAFRQQHLPKNQILKDESQAVAVTLDREDPPWLAQTFKLKQVNTKKINISLEAAGEHLANITGDERFLRSFLALLFDAIGASEWKTDDLPQWLNLKTKNPEDAKERAIH